MFQLDLFGPNERSLSIARRHPHNHRCIDPKDCLWEEYQCGTRCRFSIGIGRTRDGYFYTCGCEYGAGGWGGPIFVTAAKPIPSFREARQAALDRLVEKIRGIRTNVDEGIVEKNCVSMLKKIGEIR